MRISDWSSDVCSSDLQTFASGRHEARVRCDIASRRNIDQNIAVVRPIRQIVDCQDDLGEGAAGRFECRSAAVMVGDQKIAAFGAVSADRLGLDPLPVVPARSEEHPSELQSLMRISYTVCCL